MDATVDDFFSEVNKILPPKQKQEDCDWQECYDEQTGYPYYWNVRTNDVTWEIPEEYKRWKESANPDKLNANVPPRTNFPISECKVESKIKTSKRNSNELSEKDNELKYAKKKARRSSSDSEDEKIILISSYGGDTDSEEEEKESLKNEEHNNLKEVNENIVEQNLSQRSKSPIKDMNEGATDDEDNVDLLTTIHSRAKFLKEIEGDLLSDVKNIVETNSQQFEVNNLLENNKKNKVTGISLLASYGEDSDIDQEEEEIPKTLFPISAPSKTEITVSHSTLFPIPTPIDVKQFETPKAQEKKPELIAAEVVDNKAFQRKRKIDVDLVNIQKRLVKENKTDSEPERLGIGFKSSGSEYAGFKSGGIMFVKSDTLNPPDHTQEEKSDLSIKENEKILQEIDSIQTTLSEKLGFLSEGRGSASPVQVMVIQLETLYAALKSGSLSASYLHKWLKDTCAELVKLEKDATPAGWLLQWDRSNKRYYYFNKETGQSQWNYPNVENVNGEDDEMDISTTPPPPEEIETQSTVDSVLPPPPPKISDDGLVPPPPPIISKCVVEGPSLPREPYPSLIREPYTMLVIPENQPLPPGVDVPEVAPPVMNEVKEENKSSPSANDSLTSVLDSFYSDIAAIESQIQTTDAPIKSPPQQEQNVPEDAAVVTVKKKKKVKIVQGLSMKKKGVSKLVEKWKNVQNSYD